MAAIQWTHPDPSPEIVTLEEKKKETLSIFCAVAVAVAVAACTCKENRHTNHTTINALCRLFPQAYSAYTCTLLERSGSLMKGIPHLCAVCSIFLNFLAREEANK